LAYSSDVPLPFTEYTWLSGKPQPELKDQLVQELIYLGTPLPFLLF
jgi:hypothetical protein